MFVFCVKLFVRFSVLIVFEFKLMFFVGFVSVGVLVSVCFNLFCKVGKLVFVCCNKFRLEVLFNNVDKIWIFLIVVWFFFIVSDWVFERVCCKWFVNFLNCIFVFFIINFEFDGYMGIIV